MEFKSEGMMQRAELAAEALSIQAAYQANLAKIREAEARGEVGQLGVGLTNEEIWGEGPFGLTREEREARERRSRADESRLEP